MHASVCVCICVYGGTKCCFDMHIYGEIITAFKQTNLSISFSSHLIYLFDSSGYLTGMTVTSYQEPFYT